MHFNFVIQFETNKNLSKKLVNQQDQRTDVAYGPT